jgi:hypothetical protein
VIRLETTRVVFALLLLGPGRSLERCSQGGSTVTAGRLERLAGRRSSDRTTAGSERRQVIRNETTCAILCCGGAGRVCIFGAALTRGGPEGAAPRSDLLIRGWSSGHSKVRRDDR